MARVVHKVHVTADVYTCVLSDGRIYLGKLSRDNRPIGKSFVVTEDLEGFTYSQHDRNFAEDVHETLSLDNKRLAIYRKKTSYKLSYDNQLAVLRDMKDHQTGVMIDCNNIGRSGTNHTQFIAAGKFKGTEIVSGIYVCSCGDVKVGEFAQDYKLKRGVYVSTADINEINVCKPVIAYGDFHSDSVHLDKGVLISSCGALQIGKFQKHADRIVIGTRIHGCDFWKPSVVLPESLDIGMFDSEFMLSGMGIERQFIENIKSFVKSGVWFTDDKKTSDTIGTVVLGTFKRGNNAKEFDTMQGILISSDGHVYMGCLRCDEHNVVIRGMQITPEDVSFTNVPQATKSITDVQHAKPWGTLGNTYECEFVKGKPNGVGKIIYKDGKIYFGRIKNGRRSEVGIVFFPDGHVYAGQLMNRHREGYGTNFFPSGKVLHGIFANDKLIA